MPFVRREANRFFVALLAGCVACFATAHSATASDPVEQLIEWLDQARRDRAPLADQAFSEIAISAESAAEAKRLLWEDRLKRIRAERGDEMEDRVLREYDVSMPFHFQTFGELPEDGRSLFISMHGGGGTAPRMNDRQWENQKRLYQPAEGVYVTPRAPTNTWNLWHQGHIDLLFVRMIENFVAFENVNPNRVYLLGYSAGGDGVYQLAPRMCDRWAAAAMMAGHPNDASPLGLRNVPFALQVGGLDKAFRRNEVAKKWGDQLEALQESDPEGYVHLVKIYPNKGHWMDREDAIAIPWMAKHARQATPSKIVWKQDDVTTSHCYWLSVEASKAKARSQINAEVVENTIRLSSDSVDQVTVHLDDRFVDLSKPIRVEADGKLVFSGNVERTISQVHASLERTGDVHLTFPASVTVKLPASSETP